MIVAFPGNTLLLLNTPQMILLSMCGEGMFMISDTKFIEIYYVNDHNKLVL